MLRHSERPIVVTSAFVRKNDKYLLIFDPRFGFWRVPGGKPDFGEKVEDALKREMKEELKIDVEIIRFLGFGEDTVILVRRKRETSRLLLYFECKIKKGKVKPMTPDEISEIKWLTLDEIKKHQNLEPGMIDLFRRFDFPKYL